jgi:two-component system, NtrC family, sensor kinase
MADSVEIEAPKKPRRRKARENEGLLLTDYGQEIFRYRRLWTSIVISTSLVSLIPLLIMVIVNYYQYHKAFKEEVTQPIRLFASNAERSLRFFFHERHSILDFIIHDKTYEELTDQIRMTQIFRDLKNTHPDVVDLGLIDAKGKQRSYVGPYRLKDKDYSDQEWFKETMLRGRAVSDVFLGYRRYPHFSLAVRAMNEDGQAFILRATLNAEVLRAGFGAQPKAQDTFVVNRAGVLQTPSRRYGKILDKIPLKVPPPAKETRLLEESDDDGGIRILGYGYIKDTPFILMVLEQRDTLLTSWFSLRNKLLWFLGLSIVVIVIVILVGATYSVNRIREADDKRLEALHKVEYTAKMASVGRLASGVAHEINNPLAIINEKAGLLEDILEAMDDFPHKDKFDKAVKPILDSVDRCARITRRLLRFAKHIDIRREQIQLEYLLREVLSFLEKECVYRSIDIIVDVQGEVQTIESDRGRLQQVFLNIINNAIGAVDDGGRIHVLIALEGDNHVSVTIRDNGEGIPEEHLQQIFEPFFTTKEKHGTGLGLSITYGLVEKLGGKITVDSQVGEWTKFVVTLPVTPSEPKAKEGKREKKHASSSG